MQSVTLAGRTREEWDEQLNSLFSLAKDGEDIPFNTLFVWLESVSPDLLKMARLHAAELQETLEVKHEL